MGNRFLLANEVLPGEEPSYILTTKNRFCFSGIAFMKRAGASFARYRLPRYFCRILFELIACCITKRSIWWPAGIRRNPNCIAEQAIPSLAEAIPSEEAYLITKQAAVVKSDNNGEC